MLGQFPKTLHLSKAKIALGIFLLLAAVVIGLLAVPSESPLQFNFNALGYIVLFSTLPIQAVRIVWYFPAIILLTPLGTYFLVSGIGSTKTAKVLLSVWLLIYIIYMLGLKLGGHRMIIQGFDLHRQSDLLLLYILSTYIGVLFYTLLGSFSHNDVIAVIAGLSAYLLFSFVFVSKGPVGWPDGSFVQEVTFVLGLPILVLPYAGLTALFLNLVPLIRRELSGRTSDF